MLLTSDISAMHLADRERYRYKMLLVDLFRLARPRCGSSCHPLIALTVVIFFLRIVGPGTVNEVVCWQRYFMVAHTSSESGVARL